MRSIEDMAFEATGDVERRWHELAHVVTLAMLYAWLRRGELLGLRWRDVELAHPRPTCGSTLRKALCRAGINRPMREFHDWRHTVITNAAAAGMPPVAIMRMAGHTNFATTQRYLDLADVLFGDEVSLLSKWYGHPGTNSGYKAKPSDSVNGLATGNDWDS